ncbi:hypothetical protein LMF32_10810 [Desemzia sp. C1]|uniref:hypothetical protein n=1 Tax=Desemzia sp. C1 TaxID=2892016 RepID=UPI001E38CC7A|nr:hypothetical protein [Desemzia sp. C1]MCI3029531.1 hypothetical protein [Desemzia sp. C1]
MRKFKDLEFEDQLRFYERLFKTPVLIVLISLITYEANYVLIGYLLLINIIADLIFFGILDYQKNYHYYNLIRDAGCLFIANYLTTSFMVPTILSLMNKVGLLPATSFWMNSVAAMISILVLFLLWYITICIQRKMSPNVGNWKWKRSGLFSSSYRLKAR